MSSQWLTRIVNEWMADTSGQTVARRGGTVIARYSWRAALVMFLGSLLWTAMIVLVLVSAPTPTAKIGLAACFLVFLLPTSWYLVESKTWRAEFDEVEIFVTRFARRAIRFRWSQVKSVDFTDWAQWYVIQADGQPTLRVSTSVVGGDLLVAKARASLVLNRKSAVGNRK